MNTLLKRYARIGLALSMAVLLIAVLGGSVSAAGPIYHVVQPGQTLSSIAVMYGTSVWALACANGIYNPNYIYSGMVLYVSYGNYGYCRPPYQPLPAPVVYQPHPYPPPTYGCYYRVHWGDTLTNIAWRYGTTAWALARANGLSNPNYIYAGMSLRVPGCY